MADVTGRQPDDVGPASLEDRVTIATPEGVELELQLAGLGSRFIAGLIDVIIQLLAIAVLALITGGGSGGSFDTVALLIGTFLIWFCYFIPFEVLARGQSPGKRLVHLRVVRENAAPVDLAASAIRNLVRVLDGVTLAYLPSVITIVATRRNQRPGDLAAGTLVIRERTEPRTRRGARRRWRRRRAAGFDPYAPRAAGASGAAAGTAAGGAAGGDRWDVSGISAEELATVRRFLERRETLDRKARAALATRLAEGLVAKVPGARAAGDPETFLERLVEIKSGG